MLGWSVTFGLLAAVAAAFVYGEFAGGAAIGLAKLIAIVASVLFAIAAVAHVTRH